MCCTIESPTVRCNGISTTSCRKRGNAPSSPKPRLPTWKMPLPCCRYTGPSPPAHSTCYRQIPAPPTAPKNLCPSRNFPSVSNICRRYRWPIARRKRCRWPGRSTRWRSSGTLFDPEGSTPSTHILKPDHPDRARAHSVINEWFVMTLAKRVGLAVPEVTRLYVPEPAYLVARFDRTHDAGHWQRQHCRGCHRSSSTAPTVSPGWPR